MSRVVRGRFAPVKRSVIGRGKTKKVILIALVLSVLVQVIFMSSGILPFERLDGERVFLKDDTELKSIIEKSFASSRVELLVKNGVKEIRIGESSEKIGLKPEVDATTKALKSYPLWQRVVPFSSVFFGIFSNQSVITKTTSASGEFVGRVVEACRVEPSDAGVKVEGEKAVLESAADGQACEAGAVKRELEGLEVGRRGTKITVPADIVKPDVSDKDIKKILKQASEVIARKVSFNISGKQFSPKPGQIAEFISTHKNEKNKIELSLDKKAIYAYLNDVEEDIFQLPSANQAGLAINYSDTASNLSKKLLESDGEVKVSLVQIPAGTRLKKRYTPDTAGLQALVDDIVATKGRYGVSVRQIDGSVVSAAGDRVFHPASTYKMFVAYGLLRQIQAGSMSWGQSAAAGLTVRECFNTMIIDSDNTCAEWFGAKVGWSKVHALVQDLGMSNTSTLYGQQRSTANDETLFLQKLYNNELLEESYKNLLLDVMKKQKFRSGIPAGVKTTVADKVGFLDGDLHDAAIVYSKKQTYFLTILTTGSSWASIADAAAQIQSQIDRM